VNEYRRPFFLVDFDHGFSYSLFEIPQYCIYYDNVYNYESESNPVH